MVPPVDIEHDSIPLFVDYFHAISLTEEETDIFKTDVGSVEIKEPNYDGFNVVEKIINPLKVKGILKQDGNKLLVPLEGLLVMPDPVASTKFPLVMIGHGNHTGHFKVTDTEPALPITGKLEFEILPTPIPSYQGYKSFQEMLALNGIASYSINLNIVNDLRNNEEKVFESMAIDFSQRILLFFLSLKLLRVIAGEPITLPAGGDEFPIRFLTGTTFGNLTDALANPTLDSRLTPLRDALHNQIDFTRLGFMGHSRGADAISRLPAYFFNGATAPDPKFPNNPEVKRRITALSEQLGRPQQGVIKSLLALEPTAFINETEREKHGYDIENNQTMYFVIIGTHDEDVSMDPVRIYEFPKCPKVMIALNGATHNRFNSVWAHDDETKFKNFSVKTLSKAQHTQLLNSLAGSCFTGTLGGQPLHLLRFTKKTDFVKDLPKGSDDVQAAWKFGFPLTSNIPTNLDDNVSSPSKENIKGQDYPFEQELKAFFVEKINEGTTTIRIPIDPNTGEKLSNFNHFSFRFAKGFDVSSDPTRVEEKNFTIRFFENETPVGKPITGADIDKLKLRAFQAFDSKRDEDKQLIVEYSILMQTVEITLAQHLSATELPRITRIDIDIIPDDTKSPPHSTATIVLGTIGGGILGGGVGLGGAALYNAKSDAEEDDRNRNLIVGGIVGALALGGTALKILLADEHAFVFNDFLLTNRQIPTGATP